MKGFLAFILGAAAGSVGTYFFIRKKSEEYINDEIEAMRQYYAEKLDEIKSEEENAVNEAKNGQKTAKSEGSVKEFESEEEEKAHYQAMIDKLNYSSISKKDKSKPSRMQQETRPDPKLYSPVVVTSDEFHDEDYRSNDHKNYDEMHLIFLEGDEHHDAVVIDEFTEKIIPDGLELIGRDNLDSFSSEEDNITYIRNDIEQTYIEVSYDSRNYEDTEYFDED